MLGQNKSNDTTPRSLKLVVGRNLKKINLLICEIGSKLDVGIYFVCSIGRPDIHLLNKTLLKSEFRQNT